MSKDKTIEIEPFFVHSKCCMAHWELVYTDGLYGLCCEKCSKSVGDGFRIEGPDMGGGSCDCCDGENDK